MSERDTGKWTGRRPFVVLAVVLLPVLVASAALGITAMRGRDPFAPLAPTAVGEATMPAAAPSPRALGATMRPPAVVVNTPAPTPTAGPVFIPSLFHTYTALACGDDPAGTRLSGDAAQWQPLTLELSGPQADAMDEGVNPFLDYRLQVTFVGPSGQVYVVPGYFAGDGHGGGSGNVWRARFAADEPGRWRYCVSFRRGAGAAVDLSLDAGEPLAPDGAGGAFEVAEPSPDTPDFFRWGRLEYTGEHYLKFRDGPYWLKGGTNSPENFLGYAGFANAADQGGLLADFLHTYAPHARDGLPDDPALNVNPDADEAAAVEGILGALNYLGAQHVNSIYFLPMNLGGDGQETYPYLSPADNTRFDIAKLDQWGIVLEHAQRRGIALHIVLNEVEKENRLWLDGGGLEDERRLFYREMVARFAHLPAIKWNLSEEVAFTMDELQIFASYLAALDWAGHPIAVHNPAGAADFTYGRLLGNVLFSATSFQFAAEEAGALVEAWRARSAEAGRPWVIDMDENNPAGIGLAAGNAGELRKAILYDVYFSGGAGIEWYLGYHDLPLGGDLNLEDFRTRERMWNYMWYARRFMEENLPFHLMSPADELLSGESPNYGGGEVLALGGQIVAIYLPSANPSGALTTPPGTYTLRWYDPRTGEFADAPVAVTMTAAEMPLGEPPSNPDGDWVVLIVREDAPATQPALTPQPYP